MIDHELYHIFQSTKAHQAMARQAHHPYSKRLYEVGARLYELKKLREKRRQREFNPFACRLLEVSHLLDLKDFHPPQTQLFEFHFNKWVPRLRSSIY
jgi:hypothetical protein